MPQCLTLLELIRFLTIVHVPVTVDYPFLWVHSEHPALYVYQEFHYTDGQALYTTMAFCTAWGERM